MSEPVKTSIYVGTALLLSALAYFTQPGPIGRPPSADVGQPIFTNFKDPYQAVRMQIQRYDEGLGQISKFEVAQKENRWVIPSHEDYPADAEQQLKEAATALVDLRVIGVASELAGEHPLYGVVEPDPETIKVGEKGVGTLITMKDSTDKSVASLIIGQAVKDAEGQRFVRVAGRDPVYTAKIDPAKFTTKFEDWIEKDLLDLSSFDIQQVVLKDYSLDVDPTRGPTYDQRSEIAVKWNANDFKWELDELKQWQDGQLQPAELGPDEELNKEVLDGLKDALDELKIVDVERKPAGLGGDLKADKDFMTSGEAQESLGTRGFYVVRTGPDPDNLQLEVLSSDGEVLVRTKDAVEYVLRFGQIAGVAAGEQVKDQGSLNRYVFVTARLHEPSLAPPAYEPLPGQAEPPSQPVPPGADGQQEAQQTEPPSQPKPLGSEDQTTTPAPADQPAAGQDNAAETASGPGQTQADAPAEPPTPSKSPAPGEPAATGDTAQDGQPDAAEPPSDQAAPADASAQPASQAEPASPEPAAAQADTPAQEPAAETAPDAAGESKPDAAGDTAGSETTGSADATKSEEAKKADAEAERDRIIKENDRKRQEHEEKVKKAKEKVQELNFRLPTGITSFPRTFTRRFTSDATTWSKRRRPPASRRRQGRGV